MTTNDEARAAKRRAMERACDEAFAQSNLRASVSIGTTGDPPPVVYERGVHWMHDGSEYVFDVNGMWRARRFDSAWWTPTEESDVPQSVKDALTIRPALALETTAGNVPDIPTWNVGDHVRSTKADNGQADIEGPIAKLWERGAFVSMWYIPYTMLRKVPKPVTTATAFTAAEVERAKDHGSERYAEQALLCDESRLAEAEREYERIMGPIWGYTTQGDIDGEVSECTRRDSAETAAAHWETRRNFKRPLPGETPGDWARRNGVSAPWADRYAWEARVRAEMDAVARGEPVT